ncbi:DUF3109 family protein [Apibacter muscae]|uniref:DUF3109 family protein n=1 Tax=Apibacter muscae TaxID=2509004 RepID=A0A563DEF5_9FLAO|nr:DUF3109 family protein [Apibacter muscae]TWP23883.1 DUF3109 family protein [Apibacter muscae]TWP28313.1 DUF3109 family protein [Apibacter muscae]TWP30736.1 DUF3109 family protein [Apibacter muscae]
MIQIDDTLISLDLIQKEFVCNLNKCKGICCVEGDSGAPLDEDELSILDDVYDDVKPYLREEGRASIEKQGKYVVDLDGDYVTPLIDDNECAYVIYDDKGIAKCAIEKAYEDGKINYKKPISCHLYPVRLQKLKSYLAVNYDQWYICSDACTFGKELKVKVFQFLKEPLIRKFGKDWYLQLEDAEKLFNAE